MAITTFSNEFIFPNGNKVKFECDNCNSQSDVKTVIYNDKKVRSFKGVCKAMNFYNKKDELDGIVIKVKNQFNKNYYIVINSEKTYLRIGARKCFELISSLEKDKKTRVESLEELKI